MFPHQFYKSSSSSLLDDDDGNKRVKLFFDILIIIPLASNVNPNPPGNTPNKIIETILTGNQADKITYISFDLENATMTREEEETEVEEQIIERGFHI